MITIFQFILHQLKVGRMQFSKYNIICIVAKNSDPGILDPSCFSGQIRKVEARLGKLAKIRKVETN